jgi:hypothetical protein
MSCRAIPATITGTLAMAIRTGLLTAQPAEDFGHENLGRADNYRDFE